jgi:hypothetical protein
MYFIIRRSETGTRLEINLYQERQDGPMSRISDTAEADSLACKIPRKNALFSAERERVIIYDGARKTGRREKGPCN